MFVVKVVPTHTLKNDRNKKTHVPKFYQQVRFLTDLIGMIHYVCACVTVNRVGRELLLTFEEERNKNYIYYI